MFDFKLLDTFNNIIDKLEIEKGLRHSEQETEKVPTPYILSAQRAFFR